MPKSAAELSRQAAGYMLAAANAAKREATAKKSDKTTAKPKPINKK